MEHVEDVERLFSWLKAPMVHYREFAPRTEIAEAVAAWPAVHRAAVQSGRAPADEPGPRGAAAARERIEREQRIMPATAEEAPPAPARPSGEPDSSPAGERLRAAHRASAAAAPGERDDPAVFGFEEKASGAASGATPRPEPARPSQAGAAQAVAARAAAAPAGHRGALFGGEYRGRDPEPRSGLPAAARPERSLEAVFSRLAAGRDDRLPDPRARARTSPGLGGVFGRLR